MQSELSASSSLAGSMFEFTPLTEEDIPFLIEVRSECRACLHDNREFSLEQCLNWFRTQRPDFHLIRLNGQRIGYFRLSNHDAQRRTIYVGADLEKSFRGQGLGRRAYEEFLPQVKAKYHVDEVQLEVLSNNHVAHRLYLRLGFRETDRKRAFAERDGVTLDSIVMAKQL